METKTIAEVLREHPFVTGLKESYIHKLAEMALEVQFAKDQLIFRQGDESGLFYLVLSGKVALEATAPGRISRIQTVGETDALGWSVMLGPGGKNFQARALEAVRALAFDGARLRQLCEQDPGFGFQFTRKLLHVVSERLQAARMQLLDIYAPRTGGKLV